VKKEKMKNKTLASLEIAIVFCLLFFVALPSIAAASEDETLDIYGNADEDDIIDMRDLTFTARMILRLEDETELADANYDGRVSVADMTQIGLIILGRESKLTLVDSADRIVTVNKPVEKIVSSYVPNSEAVSLLGVWYRVVGRDVYTTDEILFPGASDLPVICQGYYSDVDFEKVHELEPDIFLSAVWLGTPGFEDVIAALEPEIPVVALNFLDPATLVENIRKLRYVLNTEESGEAYIAFCEGVVNDITAKTAGLSEEEKPRVFFLVFNFDYQEQYTTIAGDYTPMQSQYDIVGATNIAEDLTGWYPYVSDEWLLAQSQDPGIDVIVSGASPLVVQGIFGYGIDDAAVAWETRDWIMAAEENPVLADSDAVKDGRVYLYQGEMASSPRFVVSLAYMAKWLHPELFSDLDPQAIHQEYLDFLGIGYDLDEHGVLFYPEEPVVE
jgi:iron complex transport system substrate-binding protein